LFLTQQLANHAANVPAYHPVPGIADPLRRQTTPDRLRRGWSLAIVCPLR
jgi:hypothetical protein